MKKVGACNGGHICSPQAGQLICTLRKMMTRRSSARCGFFKSSRRGKLRYRENLYWGRTGTVSCLPVSGCMLEAKLGYSFDDRITGPLVTDLKKENKTYATHGYSPEKPEYGCCFVLSGKGIKKGHQLGEVHMVDIAPTIASILGVDFGPCDGEVLEDAFLNIKE